MNYNERGRKRAEVGSIIKVYLVGGMFYLLLFGFCALSFASAQAETGHPRPQLRQSRPAIVGQPAGPCGQLDQSVTFQNNTVHDGFNAASPLVPPLVLKWSRNFSANGVTRISYPLIAQGLVFVTTTTQNNYGDTLLALDEHTGATIWSADIPGDYYFADTAYDSGKVFVVNFNGLMKAFDAASGTLLWSVSLPGQYIFTSPPTAVNGVVFTGGTGDGGTVYAVNETNGAVLWTMPVDGGDSSAPAVDGGKLFVSYACPQAYGFSVATGQQLWHYASCCDGGGGKTPVVHLGQVYVRNSLCTPGYSGLVLDAVNGHMTGEFNSDTPPAFIGNLALYFQSGILRGVDLPSGQVLWSFAGNGSLSLAPLIVNQTIYISSSSGTLFGLNTSGQLIWSSQVGAPISSPDEAGATVTTGLGAGDGLLIVPTGGILRAYGMLPTLAGAVSRKTHGAAGPFDINLPLTGNSGIECRTGGATRDYTMVVTFGTNVTVTGNPQAEVTLGTGCVGSSGTCSGNVSISGNAVTIPLTNIASAQTINVRINGVNSVDAPATDFTIPMSILIGDTNGNGAVNASDVSQTDSRVGQQINATNFGSDTDASGSIDAADVALMKANLGTGLP